MDIQFAKFSSLLLPFVLLCLYGLGSSQAQQEPTTQGYTCVPNQTIDPCHTYAFYRAMAPDFLDLASIADLFLMSRLMISNPSNISSPTSPLIPNQSLFVPLTCSCNTINSSFSISYSPINYTIKPGNTFYLVSTNFFQNLTTYESVEIVNPTLVPTNLEIGVNVIFPIFCKCPSAALLRNRTNYLISYVFQPSDTIASIASRFGSNAQSIIDVNGNSVRPFDTVFIPVSRLPVFSQSEVPPATSEKGEKKSKVIGLAIGLGICGLLLILISGFWGYRESLMKKKRERDEEKYEREGKRKIQTKDEGMNLLADVSDCLDKYKVYGIEDLREATQNFDERWLIQGSVYKGCIDGEVYAIKKLNWNAYQELKILQKVNHGNLVKLEGFCVDPEDANCYLVYEYVENGSLYSWLHGENNEKLSWKTRLSIGIDVANGLQYIHEHTRPKVVHKDIKTSNILLDKNMRAKIANFGLAKSGCNAITTHIVGTLGYIAPEYLTDGVVSIKMDVFAFGVVLLELISGEKATDEEERVLWAKAEGVLDGEGGRNLRRLKDWMDSSLLKETCPMESVMNAMSLAIACVNKDPSKRPGMVDIVYALCKSSDLLFDASDDGLSPRLLLAR